MLSGLNGRAFDELAAFKVEPVGFPSFPATGDPFDSLVKKLDCGRE